MKNFLSDVFDLTRPPSIKILLSSFMTGYLLATLLFAFFRPQIHQFLEFIVQGL